MEKLTLVLKKIIKMHSKILSALEENNIHYKEIEHSSFLAPINSPIDFAGALGLDLERISKSVFLRSKKRDKYIIAVCSCNKKLDLKKIAALADVNKIEVADRQELESMIGYPPTGVSAIGLNPSITVFIDNALLNLETIFIGSGEIAKELELSPKDLVKLSNGKLSNIC
ncbi:aminoacyl-tRNA deacylase [Pedobacter mendelii]|uniref:Cys-tRNA(Pro)/Cys-tRNA(Cys) deacylase n=1 Tax=Pedobacter mendelii TaxID=1908240 RepID=A0ABQ2BJD8_9SPHI|nr:YbaK/EbsC family protein [Pedobacter mendelii]GGI25700.1 Cys-tRNA(Pro)/Cys-tRNA(Cys) deacylase [Pedobacter mendelii]